MVVGQLGYALDVWLGRRCEGEKEDAGCDEGVENDNAKDMKTEELRPEKNEGW